jgi:hypothetical protein
VGQYCNVARKRTSGLTVNSLKPNKRRVNLGSLWGLHPGTSAITRGSIHSPRISFVAESLDLYSHHRERKVPSRKFWCKIGHIHIILKPVVSWNNIFYYQILCCVKYYCFHVTKPPHNQCSSIGKWKLSHETVWLSSELSTYIKIYCSNSFCVL